MPYDIRHTTYDIRHRGRCLIFFVPYYIYPVASSRSTPYTHTISTSNPHTPIHPYTHTPIHPYTHTPIHPTTPSRRSYAYTLCHTRIHLTSRICIYIFSPYAYCLSPTDGHSPRATPLHFVIKFLKNKATLLKKKIHPFFIRSPGNVHICIGV
jgi:hypothetical protein